MIELTKTFTAGELKISLKVRGNNADEAIRVIEKWHYIVHQKDSARHLGPSKPTDQVSHEPAVASEILPTATSGDFG